MRLTHLELEADLRVIRDLTCKRLTVCGETLDLVLRLELTLLVALVVLDLDTL
jgi:hypothetical protein